MSGCAGSLTPIPPGPGGGRVGEDWKAMVACCANGDEKQHACGVWWCDNAQQPKNKCVKKCILKHEQRHIQQCEGKVEFPPLRRVPNQELWGECDASLSNVNCVVDAMTNSKCFDVLGKGRWKDYPKSDVLRKIKECTKHEARRKFPITR